jgi:hypothetical protein
MGIKVSGLVNGVVMAASMLALAPAANAAIQAIDFTNANPWGAVQGQTSFTSAGVTVSSQGTAGGKLTFNAIGASGDPARGLEPCGVYACDGDGIGIGDDEVSWKTSGFDELLEVQFDSAVTVTEISFLDLFNEGTGREIAFWYYNGDSSAISFLEAPLTNDSWPATNGFGATTGLSVTDVTSITFLVDCAGNNCAANDYALAGIKTVGPDSDVSEVPLPAAAWLFGSGLIGLAGIARRRKSA